MTPPNVLLDRVNALLASDVQHRYIAAIAGPPASGKSTLAKDLVAYLNRHAPERAAWLPMDGFHYDDGVLAAHGWRPRKGAPHTFDLGGLTSTLVRLRANKEETIAIPHFDRALEISRAGAALIPQTCQLIVAEGNYLLLDRPFWRDLRTYFDLTIYLDVPESRLTERLVARWRAHHVPHAESERHITDNDLPNARLIAQNRLRADIVL